MGSVFVPYYELEGNECDSLFDSVNELPNTSRDANDDDSSVSSLHFYYSGNKDDGAEHCATGTSDAKDNKKLKDNYLRNRLNRKKMKLSLSPKRKK